MVIPRLSDRLTSMLYRRRLEMEQEELKPELNILRGAADELRRSQKFRKLLAVSIPTLLTCEDMLTRTKRRRSSRSATCSMRVRSEVTPTGSNSTLSSRLFPHFSYIPPSSPLLQPPQLKDTRSSSPSASTPTLLHYLARVLLRSDPSLLSFLEDVPHVEAASRVSFSTVQGAAHGLVGGVEQVKEEIRVLNRMRISPAGDRFVAKMEVCSFLLLFLGGGGGGGGWDQQEKLRVW